MYNSKTGTGKICLELENFETRLIKFYSILSGMKSGFGCKVFSMQRNYVYLGH